MAATPIPLKATTEMVAAISNGVIAGLLVLIMMSLFILPYTTRGSILQLIDHKQYSCHAGCISKNQPLKAIFYGALDDSRRHIQTITGTKQCFHLGGRFARSRKRRNAMPL